MGTLSGTQMEAMDWRDREDAGGSRDADRDLAKWKAGSSGNIDPSLSTWTGRVGKRSRRSHLN